MKTEENQCDRCHDPEIYDCESHCIVCDDPINLGDKYYWNTEHQTDVCPSCHDRLPGKDEFLQTMVKTNRKEIRYKYQNIHKLSQHKQKGNPIVQDYYHPKHKIWVILYRIHTIEKELEPIKFKDSKTVQEVLKRFY